MTQATPEQPGATLYVDYRPSRCRCGSIVRPYEVVCLQCGRQQNLLFEGLEKIYADDLDGLIADLEKEVSARPYDYIRLFHLAGAHLLRGRFEIARDIYRRVLQLKSDFSPARLNLGITLACLGESDAAATELRLYVKHEPHSSKAERVIRAICSIKNIPYEDALRETGLDNVPKGPVGRRPETHLPPRGRLGRRFDLAEPAIMSRKRVSRPWLIFDLILLFCIAVILAGWFGFPTESKKLLASAISYIEQPFRFQVVDGKVKSDGTPENSEGDEALSTSQPEDQVPPGAIVNASPTSTSFFPLKQGNTWTYAAFDARDPSGVDQIRSSGSRTMTVTRLVNEKKGVWAVRNGPDTIYYVEESNGLFSLENPDAPWGEMIAQVPYPAEVGRSMTALGQTVTVDAEEDIEVAAGKFHCVRLKYSVKEPSGMEWYSWYAQGIGLVKYRGGGRDGTYHFLELGKYRLK